MKPYCQKEEQGYLGSTMKALPSVANQPQEPRLPRERPILFSSEMVRAILDGRKTQTRRVVLPKPDERYGAILWGSPRYDNGDGAKYFHTSTLSPSIMKCWADACPFGKPGDRLWVRETWAEVYDVGDGQVSVLRPSSERSRVALRKAIYRATAEVPEDAALTWKPSIHMARWASRITLEITGVRVERVQDIGGQDAIAEGIERRDDYYLGGPHRRVKGKTKVFTLAWQAYKDIWNNLNAKRGYGWDVNPWVWVIEFKRVEARDA